MFNRLGKIRSNASCLAPLAALSAVASLGATYIPREYDATEK